VLITAKFMGKQLGKMSYLFFYLLKSTLNPIWASIPIMLTSGLVVGE
jgi:hypothetical protein